MRILSAIAQVKLIRIRHLIATLAGVQQVIEPS
jgi:hypothetical protein